MDLQNKVAIITGGSGGLGMAAAKAYLAKGAKVAVFDLQEGDAGALAEANPGQIKYYETNVTTEENVAANINQVVEDFGSIDVCINCAGFGPSAKTYSRRKGPHPLEQFQNVINVNLVGTFNVLRLAVEKMSANEGDEKGVIINTASIAAFEGQIGQVAYTAAKAGIAGMCLTMARDLGPVGIRALAIAPSLFATGLTKGIPDEFAKALTKDAAFPKRLGKPEEFAKLVAAIVENPMLNGQCIRLDAGQRFAPK